jgi:RNA polymerase sigma factor, sigma-70 family
MQEDKTVAELIELCKQNDSLAQKDIYDRYKDKLFTICLRYTQTYADAQDLLIDGYVKIFTNIGNFEVRTNAKLSFEAWAKRIIINAAINNYKTQKRAKRYSYNDDIHANFYNVSETYTTSEAQYSQEKLLATIQRLTPKLRMVFNLFAVEEMTAPEIAQKLGMTEGGVRIEIFRARTKLKRYLQEIKIQK